jgi:hypothetical protein
MTRKDCGAMAAAIAKMSDLQADTKAGIILAFADSLPVGKACFALEEFIAAYEERPR